MQIKAVTYNVFHCAIPETNKINYDFYANVIKKHDADVVCLQEVHVGGTKYDGKDQPKKLATLAGYPYHCFGNAMDQQGGGKYGNAILSKYPISNIKVYPLGGERSMVSADVTKDGRKFRICSTHISGSSDGVKQINNLKSVMTNWGMDHLLGGDFNCEPSSTGGNLLDSFLDYTRKSGIDHILCNGPWHRVKQFVSEDGNGDHDPVVGFFEIA